MSGLLSEKPNMLLKNKVHDLQVQPVSMDTCWSQIPLDGTLQLLRNLKRLRVFNFKDRRRNSDRLLCCATPFLSHEGLLALVGRPNFTVEISNFNGTSISVDGLTQIVQVGWIMDSRNTYCVFSQGTEIPSSVCANSGMTVIDYRIWETECRYCQAKIRNF